MENIGNPPIKGEPVLVDKLDHDTLRDYLSDHHKTPTINPEELEYHEGLYRPTGDKRNYQDDELEPDDLETGTVYQMISEEKGPLSKNVVTDRNPLGDNIQSITNLKLKVDQGFPQTKEQHIFLSQLGMTPNSFGKWNEDITLKDTGEKAYKFIYNDTNPSKRVQSEGDLQLRKLIHEGKINSAIRGGAKNRKPAYIITTDKESSLDIFESSPLEQIAMKTELSIGADGKVYPDNERSYNFGFR